jgi:hypothetical protein
VTMTRRHLLQASSMLLGRTAFANLEGIPHHKATAKRVIYLFQHGGPSQIDMFDHKPGLAKLRGADLPPSVRMGQRLTGMTAYQAAFPTARVRAARTERPVDERPRAASSQDRR